VGNALRTRQARAAGSRSGGRARGGRRAACAAARDRRHQCTDYRWPSPERRAGAGRCSCTGERAPGCGGGLVVGRLSTLVRKRQQIKKGGVRGRANTAAKQKGGGQNGEWGMYWRSSQKTIRVTPTASNRPAGYRTCSGESSWHVLRWGNAVGKQLSGGAIWDEAGPKRPRETATHFRQGLCSAKRSPPPLTRPTCGAALGLELRQ